MKKSWVITEGMAGTENQCLGVAEALGLHPAVKKINLNQPWKLLSPYLPFEQSYTFNPKLYSPWPDLLISSGRKSIAASRYIKKMSNGKTFTVQIQDPRVSSKYFDLVCVPEHDRIRGDNVIVTTAAPNRITQKKLQLSKAQFSSQLESLPSPRVAVLIGGNSRAHRLTKDISNTICDQLLSLNAGLMITASRRTGDENMKIFTERLYKDDIYFWNGKEENPYFGFLAWADYILVTADSVSMLSEAATTGKPVYMIPLEGGSDRLSRLHNNLLSKNIIRVFDGNLQAWSYNALNDSKLIADEILKRLKN